MHVSGTPNKFEIFQNFYYVTNGVQISYSEALRLFAQMDEDTANDFEQYYQDETGYEIIVPCGYNMDNNITLKTYTDNGKEKVVRVNGKVVKQKKVTNPDGSITIVETNSSTSTQNAINIQYTLEAYAKKNGLVLDPQWAIYSAEEIMQMVNEGVNVPQDVIDIANTIMQSTAASEQSIEGEDGQENTTLSFLELIPLAEKKIEKCDQNNEKIEKEIQDLLPEQEKRKRNLDDQMKEQRRSLKEYESFVREWNHIQTKINNGEALSTSEARRYADLMGLFEEKKSGDDKGFSLDKREIAKSMNELNILAILGEKLADETIEIGDTLADYTSVANYKTTRNQARGEIGFLRAIVAMAQGKTLAKEANVIGNDTKDFTNETQQSVNDIASTLDIGGMIAGKDEILGTEQPKEPTAGSEEAVQDGEQQPAQDGQAIQETENQGQNNKTSAEVTEQEDFVINDKNVKGLIKEAVDINADLAKQTISAVKAIKVAKDDRKFAKIAGEKVTKLVKEFKQREEKRQARIQAMEQENKEANQELENLTGKSADELNEEQPTEKQPDDKTDKEKVAELRQKIASNNEEIENLKIEAEESKGEFANATAKESEIISQAIPSETEALKKDTEYKEEIIPAAKERLDFTDASGETLSKIGTYRIELGMMQIMAWQFEKGLRNVALGTISTGIGLAAQVVGDSPIPTIAEKATDKAVKEEDGAINDLTTLEAEIISITGEEATEVPAGEDEENEEGVENADNNEETTPAESSEEGEEPTTEAPATETTVKTTTAQSNAQPAQPTAKGAMGGMLAANQAEKDKIKELVSSGTKETTGNNKSKADKKEEMSTDQANDNVKKAEDTGKEDSKDSEQVLKDTEKDEKQLEKETKKLVKEMKRDQKQIEKMTKQSQKAAKKQADILVQYEAINAENEQLIAEDEANKQSQQASGIQPAQNETQQNGTLASNNFSMGGSDNSDKLQQNDQIITTLSTEFNGQERIITRNHTKIKKLQKSTKTKSKKFEKKTKIRDTKIKEAEKKEQDKQKRLAKQLAAVGIANNIFSITMSTGTLLMLNPFTQAVGQAMFIIGLRGTVYCALTSAIINLANGNLQAALMGLGTTAISIASSFIPGAGAATQAVLGAVSAGLNVVSSSAELVNNVRAVQGKEASGVFSKISTIAGIASAATSAASSLSNLGNTASTFGKALTIANTVGTALSSTSQIMSEFNLGSEKTANLLGTIGGGINLAASAIQLGQSLKNKANGTDNNGGDEQNSETHETPKTKQETRVEGNKLVDANGKEITLPKGCTIKDGKVVDANGKEVKVGADGKIKTDNSTKTSNNTSGNKNKSSNDNTQTATVQNGKLVGPNGKEVRLPEGCRIEGTKVVDATGAEVTISPTGQITQTTSTEGSSVQNGKIFDKNGKEVKLPQGYKVVGDQVMGPNGKFVRLDANGNIVKADHQQQIKDAKAAKERQQGLAKGTDDKNKKQEILNGSSTLYADKSDSDLQKDQLNNIGSTKSLDIQEELNNRTQYRNQMDLLTADKQAKMDKIGQILDITGQVANTAMSVTGMFMAQKEGETKKKHAAPGKLTERTKEIMRKNAKYRKRRVQALTRVQRYYA